MVRYLLDTVTISELRKDRPAETVIRFLEITADEHLFLSVLTIGEIADGIDRMPVGARRTRLMEWFRDTQVSYADRILPIDGDIAEHWGKLSAIVHRLGRRLQIVDGLIAATALVHDLTVVTRNVKDFDGTGVRIMNPWHNDDAF